jgi:DNA-binding response OmpR family regulator
MITRWRIDVALTPTPPAVDRGPKVVVLSGHPGYRAARSEALTAAGLRVVAVDSIQAARRVLAASVACLVLDRRAPDGDALVLVDELYRTDGAPRMVVIATGESDRERVESLVAGADDVVSPEVSAVELVARVRRLATPVETPIREERRREIAVGRVVIDQDRRSVRVDGAEVSLSPTQYQILVSLAVEGGRAVTVRSLVELCWDAHQDRSSCALRTQVTRLRRALRGAVDIRCVRGEGYRLAEAEG